MDTVGKRLKEIVRRMLYTQRRFAEETGIPESNLSNVMKDRSGLSLAMKKQIADKFPNINLDWVEMGSGHGEPFYKERKDTLQPDRFWDESAICALREFILQKLPADKAAEKAGEYANAMLKVRQKARPAA